MLSFLLGPQLFQASSAVDLPTPKVEQLINAEEQHTQAAAPSPAQSDQYNRETPRSSLLALSKAQHERDCGHVMHYLDLRILDIVGAAGTRLTAPARSVGLEAPAETGGVVSAFAQT